MRMTPWQLVTVQDFLQNYNTVLKSLIQGPKFLRNGDKTEAVLIAPEVYEEMRQQLIAQKRDEEVQETMQNGKSYDNVEDLIGDLTA